MSHEYPYHDPGMKDWKLPHTSWPPCQMQIMSGFTTAAAGPVPVCVGPTDWVALADVEPPREAADATSPRPIEALTTATAKIDPMANIRSDRTRVIPASRKPWCHSLGMQISTGWRLAWRS